MITNDCINELVGKKVGTVFVSMYKEEKTGLPFFNINADDEKVLPLSYIIEDSLNNY